MEKKKIYTGTVKKITHVTTTAFGMRMYIIHFDSGNAILQIHKKKTLVAEVNKKLNFTGEWYGNSFVIENTYDFNQEQMDQIMSKEYERKLQIEHQ